VGHADDAHLPAPVLGDAPAALAEFGGHRDGQIRGDEQEFRTDDVVAASVRGRSASHSALVIERSYCSR